ncbi:tRNA (adenine(22)-N(1))-methyltransferase TrmK [Halobacillus yeomjeoni]|uniref:tRNA (adenine(22)-N(1))-methyltransferase n=1 Tax=Halobacillus yeomjeoni TaxID=311194 RepID=UPI001CD2482B|nr:tRNA (adenine(22)-N(1))-methyltransferase TrmK [Halobacillus yeomjeoni]MCA0982724.1 tRNA (adenine(22)-N(1))-methyltransferase TrmK [Halobacillus yeomjeoni]
MNVNQLSNRLALVASFLPEKSNFADIGSDHAYLPCYVCLRDEKAKAIAGEVNEGPYQSALNEVNAHNLSDRIDVRLGNGLQVLEENEVNQIVIAGMGGPLIRDILDEGKDKLGAVDRIIVQPNIDARSLRIWFKEQGYALKEEEILEENGHIYEVLVAEKGDPLSGYETEQIEKELWLGPHLLKKNDQTFHQKCRAELEKKQYILEQVQRSSQVDEEKIVQLKKEITWLKEVLA